MDSFRCRPSLTDLEDRLTPISPADVFNAVAQTSNGWAAVQAIGGNPGVLSVPAFQPAYRSLLETVAQQADSAAGVFAQFVTDLRAQAATNPETADFLAPYVDRYVGAQALATTTAVYARFEANYLQNQVASAAAGGGGAGGTAGGGATGSNATGAGTTGTSTTGVNTTGGTTGTGTTGTTFVPPTGIGTTGPTGTTGLGTGTTGTSGTVGFPTTGIGTTGGTTAGTAGSSTSGVGAVGQSGTGVGTIGTAGTTTTGGSATSAAGDFTGTATLT